MEGKAKGGNARLARARHSVRGRVQAALARAGWEVRPLAGDADERRAKLLASEGIDVVLDVGANVGQYASKLRDSGYSGRIVSFEPYGQAYTQLERTASRDPGWQARRIALGEEAGEVELNVSGNSFSSSLLPIRERHVEIAPDAAYVDREVVPALRLDAIWDELVAAGERVWLKLDVQGFELPVLRGAGERLALTHAVQVELSLTSLYEGDVLWLELGEWLRERGFELVGVEPGHEDPNSGRLIQFDGVFVR